MTILIVWESCLHINLFYTFYTDCVKSVAAGHKLLTLINSNSHSTVTNLQINWLRALKWRRNALRLSVVSCSLPLTINMHTEFSKQWVVCPLLHYYVCTAFWLLKAVYSFYRLISVLMMLCYWMHGIRCLYGLVLELTRQKRTMQNV